MERKIDMKGKITHINPAATELLKLTVQDNTFEKIFGFLVSIFNYSNYQICSN